LPAPRVLLLGINRRPEHGFCIIGGVGMIHNARIATLATALNNLRVGSIIAAPMVIGKAGDPAHIGAWFALGVDLIALAQVVPGRLR
jgi:hypothetical protein